MRMCIFCNKYFISKSKDKKYCSSYCNKRHYVLLNPNKKKAWDKKYKKHNRLRLNLKQIEYNKKYPWRETYYKIKYRCNNKTYFGYKYYGGKGIKCLITIEELKLLWYRDKAYLMKKPSIDRIDSAKNYEFNNCRYIELSENISRSHKRKEK